jgi:glucan biosynthesis protein C
MSQANIHTSSAADQSTGNHTRLYFLDWVRILAFFVLIFYHVGMYYVTWDWHVKSAAASTAIEPLMMMTSPWRLSLLFLISGVASRFMLNKFKPGQFLRQRSWRLLVPLIFGMLVVVPPQTYCEVIEKLSYSGSYLDFMKLYLSGYHGFCKDGSCLALPTWNHLWFVVYLWCYTVLLTGVMFISRARFDVAAQWITSLLDGWKLMVIPLALLALMRLAMFSLFPATHALVDDWYNHAHYFFLFVLGAVLAPQRKVWIDMESMRWTTLGLALSCWALLTVYFALPESFLANHQFEIWRNVQRVIYTCCEWSAIIAVCGFAHRHLKFDSNTRRYLTQAVFPFYLLHQTIIVVVAHTIKPANLAAPIEAIVIIVMTFTFCFAMFEIVRRLPLLRPLFGIGRQEHEQNLRQSGEPIMAR